MTTDYVDYTDDPAPRLRKIADAGFSHVHWCQEWCTANIYDRDRIDDIGKHLEDNGLTLLDLHAPHGRGLGWGAADGSQRENTIRCIRNRILMTGLLGGGAIVIHLPARPPEPADLPEWRKALRGSLDELLPYCRQNAVRIALENMPDDDFEEIERLLESYEPDFLGICYDSGHGNIGRDGLSNLRRNKNRLVAVHLHDNDGSRDSHSIPFTGTVDWKRLASIIASSSYRGCISLESNMRGMDVDEDDFLRDAFGAGARLARMTRRAGE